MHTASPAAGRGSRAIDQAFPGTNVIRTGFAEVDPPHRVVFSWGFADDEAAAHTKHAAGEVPPGGSAMPAGSTRVTVTLAADGEGTRLTLRHDRLPSSELAAAHQMAWETYLPRLAIAAAGGDPGPDPHD